LDQAILPPDLASARDISAGRSGSKVVPAACGNCETSNDEGVHDTMNRRNTLSLAATGLIALCTTGIAAAQEKQRVSFKTGLEETKYTQQLFIDAGDVPGHQVRVFELHYNFPSNPPVIING
jgi:hypothetical protein